MIRWLRWQFLVPRVMLGAVAVLALQYVLGLATRSMAVRFGDATLGAPVAVAHARVSPAAQQIVLRELSVGNPRRPGQRLLEADCCELYVAIAPLLRKQVVIERGRISGVRFGGSGVASGTQDDSSAKRSAVAWFGDDSDGVAVARLASLGNHFGESAIDQFESVKRAEALCARWSADAASREERALELKQRAGQMEISTDAAQTNHLRHEELLNEMPAQIRALRADFERLSAEVDKLPQILEDERREIVAARRKDEQLLRKQLRVEPIDPNVLTAYLLRKQIARPLDELVGWLRWAQRVARADASGQRSRTRGQNILFAGVHRSPQFLIRTLELHGTAEIMNRPIELCGLVSDFTPQPSKHNVPMRIQVSSSGPTPFKIQASIDRTNKVARDELYVDFHNIRLPEASLGRPDQLQLNLGPSVGSISVSMSIEGGKLSGDIQLVQKEVRITPVIGCDLSDVPLAAPLSATLGEVNSLATRINLNGTIDKPSCTLWSNLGPAVAEALEQAVQRGGEEHAQVLLADAWRQVDERLAGLEREVADHQQRFASEMSGMPTRLDSIARRQSRRERISVEQLGRRLPNNSLFK